MNGQHSSSQNVRVFALIWFGQVISVLGSGLTSFALGVWVYEQTGSVTQFALIGLSAVLPKILLSPVAGVIVDRWDRRRVMLLSDCGAGVSTLLLALVLTTDQLATWHIYLATVVNAGFNAFQWPAYVSLTTTLVPQQHLGRANGMVQVGQALSEVFAPALAGILAVTIGLRGVLLVDVVTFVLAVSTLAIVRIPGSQIVAEQPMISPSSWIQASWQGWLYIKQRTGLLYLLIFSAVVNFLWGMVGALIVPMIRDFADPGALGMIISVAGLGLLSGSLFMSFWGGPSRKVYGVLSFELLSGFCFLVIGAQPWAPLVALGAFGAHFTIAIVNGCGQTIWQRQVPPEMQGRVFSIQQMLARSMAPLAFLLAGPLADRVFAPLLAPDGPLASSVGLVLGVGPGRGVALLFVVMGIAKIVVSAVGFLNERVRTVEMPDADIPAVMRTVEY